MLLLSLAFSRLCYPPVLVPLIMCFSLPSFTHETMKRPSKLQWMFEAGQELNSLGVMPLAAVCPVTFLVLKCLSSSRRLYVP